MKFEAGIPSTSAGSPSAAMAYHRRSRIGHRATRGLSLGQQSQLSDTSLIFKHPLLRCLYPATGVVLHSSLSRFSVFYPVIYDADFHGDSGMVWECFAEWLAIVW